MTHTTPLSVSIIASIGALAMLGVVFELIRRRHLRERYSLIWLLTGVVLLVLAVWRQGLNTIAGWLGVKGYPPSVFFAALLFFVLVMLLHYSIVKRSSGTGAHGAPRAKSRSLKARRLRSSPGSCRRVNGRWSGRRSPGARARRDSVPAARA